MTEIKPLIKNPHGYEKIINGIMNGPLKLTESQARDATALIQRKINHTPIIGPFFKAQRKKTQGEREKTAKAEEMSLIDPLTGLGNRRYLEGDNERVGEFKQELAEAIRYGHNLSIIFLDLDNFKSINDTYGHGVGDDFLRLLTKAMRETFRQSDDLARFGGEEFVAILPESGRNDVKAVVKRLHLNYEKLQNESGLLKKNNISTPNTLSIGVSFLHDASDDIRYKDIESGMILLNEADQAMYKAKNSGRNQTAVFDS